MTETSTPVKLRRQRRIVWYALFALLFFSVALANLGFQGASGITSMLIFPTLLYALLLGYRIGRAEGEQPKPIAKEDIKIQPYGGFLIGNLLFAGLVAFWCSFSVFVIFFIGLIVMVVLLPMAINAGKGGRELQRRRWTRFLIYALAVAVGWMLDHQASENEQRNFNNIIVAVEQYKVAEKRYPDTLEQLVPKYLGAVPAARFGKFMYLSNNPDDAHLSYDSMPYIHNSYSFKSKTRRSWD